MKKNVVFRIDVFSRDKFNRKELLRINISKNNTYIDLENNGLGRGVYFKQENLKTNKQLLQLKRIVNSKNGDFSTIEEELKRNYLKEV